MKPHKLPTKQQILTDLINGKVVSSLDYNVSNSNQYFTRIKDKGIVLDEISIICWKGLKMRRLDFEPSNLKRAKEYLAKLQWKSSK